MILKKKSAKKDAADKPEKAEKKAAPKKTAKKKEAAPKEAKAVKLAHYDVVRSPIITEKSTAASEQSKMLFRVAGEASKQQIKEAVEALFGVKVLKVNTLVRKGKRKGFRGNSGQQSDVKRAIVTLEKDQSIDIAAGAR